MKYLDSLDTCLSNNVTALELSSATEDRWLWRVQTLTLSQMTWHLEGEENFISL